MGGGLGSKEKTCFSRLIRNLYADSSYNREVRGQEQWERQPRVVEGGVGAVQSGVEVRAVWCGAERCGVVSLGGSVGEVQNKARRGSPLSQSCCPAARPKGNIVHRECIAKSERAYMHDAGSVGKVERKARRGSPLGYKIVRRPGPKVHCP